MPASCWKPKKWSAEVATHVAALLRTFTLTNIRSLAVKLPVCKFVATCIHTPPGTSGRHDAFVSSVYHNRASFSRCRSAFGQAPVCMYVCTSVRRRCRRYRISPNTRRRAVEGGRVLPQRRPRPQTRAVVAAPPLSDSPNSGVCNHCRSRTSRPPNDKKKNINIACRCMGRLPSVLFWRYFKPTSHPGYKRSTRPFIAVYGRACIYAVCVSECAAWYSVESICARFWDLPCFSFSQPVQKCDEYKTCNGRLHVCSNCVTNGLYIEKIEKQHAISGRVTSATKRYGQ